LKKALFIFVGWSLLASFCGVLAVLSGTYLYLNPSLPDVETLKEIEFQIPLRVFSADDKLIGEFGEKRRDPVTFEEIPQLLIDAILSAEDDGFYSHQGVDITGLLRAVSELALSGSIQSGGSTITMQVARNFFLSRNQTFSRKFNEILLAIKIEQELNKQDILTLYLNKIYLGNRAYGIKAAAKVYYGKPLMELSLAQLAMIAGLPKAPSTFNPIINPSRALVRRDYILRRMLSLEKITKEEHRNAISEPVSAIYHGQQLDLYAPYAAEMAREKAVGLLGEKAYTGGYIINTTVDSRLQAAGQRAIVNGLLAYTERHGYRGPEQQLDLNLLTPLASNEDAKPSANDSIALKSSQLGEVNLMPWVKALEKIPSFGGLRPAAVIKIEDRAFTAILDSGQPITIEWENGLNKAGAYVNENFSSPTPKTANKIVKLGDVVRVYQKQLPTENSESDTSAQTNPWHFSQIPRIQGALTALNPKNGAIKTIIGGFDFNHTAFNRAYQAKRLPGSNFKPFIYSVGLENGLSAATIFNDAPIVIEDSQLESTWRPENSSGKFYGPTRLRKALYLSRNLVSIRLLRTIGIDAAIKGVTRFSIDSNTLPRDLSLALGTYVMTPLEIATGYSVFANNGYKVKPFLVARITDNQGDTVFEENPWTVMEEEQQPPQQYLSQTTSNTAPTIKPLLPISPSIIAGTGASIEDSSALRRAPRVMDERIAFIMNSILRDVVARGTAKKAQQLKRSDIGGKTGTTNGPTDAWFSGFNQHLVATAWVGFDNNNNIGKREYGGTAALPIWMDFMKVALKGIPDTIPPQPNGIVTVRINPETGELTNPNNPDGIDEMFLEENVPTEIIENADLGTETNTRPEDIF
jgi:penicillin-binding protein 1A